MGSSYLIRLGNTGLHVSRLCLGTMTFGSSADERESFAISPVRPSASSAMAYWVRWSLRLAAHSA